MSTEPSLLATLDWQKNPDHRLILQNMVASQPQMLEQVMRTDIQKPPVEEVVTHEPIGTKPIVPMLPKSAQIDSKLMSDADEVGYPFRDTAKGLNQKASMTPRIFLESAALWAVGLAVARRCRIRLNYGDIYPHLYMLWVAPTTYYHKTTGLSTILELVRNTIPHLLLPETTTPETLIAKLSGQKPGNYAQLSPSQQKVEDLGLLFAGQRGFCIDEATKLFSTKKYMEGFTEALMQLYDAPSRVERELRTEGKFIVYNPALSLLGATTPTLLARYVSDVDWECGMLARFALVTPVDKQVAFIPNATPDSVIDPILEPLKARLLRIYQAFPMPEVSEEYQKITPINARMDETALNYFNAYAEAMHEMTNPVRRLDERLRGNYGRFPTLALKLALILAIMDWVEEGAKDAPRISAPHWARAQLLTEEYRASAHRLLADLNVSQDVKNEERILDFIMHTESIKPPTKREIHRGTGIRNRTDAYAAVDALLASGAIVEIERSNSDGTGGRPTKGYKLVKQ
jgi:hypothetical protein